MTAREYQQARDAVAEIMDTLTAIQANQARELTRIEELKDIMTDDGETPEGRPTSGE